MSKSNFDICNSIYDRYIEDNDLNEISKIISNLPQLVQNNLACVIESSESVSSPSSIMYRLAAKFIQKYNKKIKKNRRLPIEYEFGDARTMWNNINVDLFKLTKYILDNGTYFAALDDNNYCMLETKVDSNYMCDIKLYFIGDNWKKWRDKFIDKINKYKKIDKRDEPECIVTNNGYSNTIFKSFDNLVMSNKKQILKYIDNWVDCIPLYYNNYNMVPKLSILLYGEPGTGKSTFYKSLAKYLGIHNVTIVDKSFLTKERRRTSGSTIYAIDDIDCICQSRADTKNNDNSSTLSTLLEFLDNPPTISYTAKDGISYPIQIVVATTNYYDKLDPAVKRYGRFDLKINMGNFNKKLAQQMCDMYGLKIEKLVSDSDDYGFEISPAKLQAMCLNNIDKKIKQGLERENGLIRVHRRLY